MEPEVSSLLRLVPYLKVLLLAVRARASLSSSSRDDGWPAEGVNPAGLCVAEAVDIKAEGGA